MSGFDSDIASLIDDVLQDKEPEVEAKPYTPETPQEVVTGDDLVTEPVAEALSPDENLVEMTEPDGTTTLVDGGDLATVASEDVASAELPEIDNSMFSEPVVEEHVPIPSFTDEELMEQIDIRNFGTLVSLSNRRWHAKVRDRKAAKDAADASGADPKAYEARKRLLVGADEKLKAVHKAIDAARTDHYGMTLPWSMVGVNDIGKRAGARLLPNSLFFEYTQAMGTHKAFVEECLDELEAVYPTLIALAQQNLGKAFNQNEYPSPSTIRGHFDLSFDFEPIPSGGDYQGLQDAQVEKLAGALKKKLKVKVENAMQDAWQRLYDDVVHAANMLSNPDANFHYTLFDKLTAHATMLNHLNVTGDPRLKAIQISVRDDLTKHDVKDVRKDDALRKRLADAADKIVTQMQEYADEQ